jgi:hypothetical protein
MTKPGSKRNLSVLEFQGLKPESLGARSETSAGAAIPVQIEPGPPRADVVSDRAVIVQELEAIAQLRLFGRGRWLADRETGCALERTMMQPGGCLVHLMPGKIPI